MILLDDFLGIFPYIMVPLMNCVSQEQNAGYSSEPHELCEGEGDGGSSWWLRLKGLLSAQGDAVGVI